MVFIWTSLIFFGALWFIKMGEQYEKDKKEMKKRGNERNKLW